MDPSARSPYSPPEAVLETPLPSRFAGYGGIWTAIFASPLVAILVMSIWVTIRHGAQGDGQDVYVGLGLSGLVSLYILSIIWSGRWWARKFSLGSWTSFFLFASACGAVGQALFWVGGVGFLAILQPGYLSSGPTIDDVIGTLVGWMGMSLYAFFFGLVIRLSARRRSALIAAQSSERVRELL